ncbi:MAG: tetratricopeptide repeat protein [Myxococcaceae bacterium]
MATPRGRDPAVEEEFLGALYKGGELLAAGKIVEAREHLEKAHGLSPKNEKAQNLLGLTYFKLGLFDRASEVYEKLVNENPADATLRVNLGLVYLKTNNLERCIKEFETATDLEPTHKKAHNYLGLALAQQGTYAKAKEHFELAGSEQMAEKMTRAIANQSAPSGLHSVSGIHVPPSAPKTVVLGAEDSGNRPRPPPPPPDDVIEVMSDEEAPSDAYAMPPAEAAAPPPPPADALQSDWGASMPQPPPPPADDMRFAEDEGPGEATLSGAEVPVEEMPVLDAVVEVMPDEPLPEANGAPMTTMAERIEATAVAIANEPMPPPAPSVPSPAWLTNEAADAPPPMPAESTGWVTEHVADVPLEADPYQQQQQPSEASWSNQSPEASWSDAAAEAPPMDGAMVEASVEPMDAAPMDAAPMNAAPMEAAPMEAAPMEAAAEGYESTPSYIAPIEMPPEAAPVAAEPMAAEAEALPTTPDDDSWATGGMAAPAEEEVVRAAAPQPALDPVPEPMPEAAMEAQPVPPEPSAPLPITVDEAQAPPPPMAHEHAGHVGAPAGYTPMSPQRLVDLGASGSWVQEPSAGPFHLSVDGLAVTVAGEMLMRMSGLIAVVGSIDVAPEQRRRRGRPTQDPFGPVQNQLQRVKGSGVVYLEPGKTKFHAVDLTDQNGVSIDDDGAYLREELVFAFEEPIAFENGRLSNDAQSLELVHLKGTGRVLLQLDGMLKAMPIPLGAPLVVPVARMVGWFGRVTPRLMGFGGRGAVELTGEGYALLGTPS